MKHIGLGVMAIALLVGVVGFSVYQTTTSRNSSNTEATGVAESADLGLTVSQSPLKVSWTGPNPTDPQAKFVVVLKNSDGTNVEGSRTKTTNSNDKSADYSFLSLPKGQYTAQLRYVPPTGTILVDRENFTVEEPPTSNRPGKRIEIGNSSFEIWSKKPPYGNDGYFSSSKVLFPVAWDLQNNSHQDTPNDENYRRSSDAHIGKYSLILRSHDPKELGNEYIWSEPFPLKSGTYNAKVFVKPLTEKLSVFCRIKSAKNSMPPNITYITVSQAFLNNMSIHKWTPCQFSFTVKDSNSINLYIFDIGVNERPFQVSSALFDDVELVKIN